MGTPIQVNFWKEGDMAKGICTGQTDPSIKVSNFLCSKKQQNKAKRKRLIEIARFRIRQNTMKKSLFFSTDLTVCFLNSGILLTEASIPIHKLRIEIEMEED